MDLLPWMKQWNMLPSNGGIILCAVSGGRDSICLLHYLYCLSKEQNFQIAAGHYNHLMRDTAERDESFVRLFCEERNIPFFVESGRVYEISETSGIGVEETGRRLRYDFLNRTAEKIGAEKIATAHHAGDQSETVLLNLIRGTGTDGLTGIPPVRGKIIRPLLNTPREEIEKYLAENHLGHVEDETNTNLDFARNRLRLIIWPELEKINSAVRNNIIRSASIVRKDNELLEKLTMEYMPETGTAIDCEAVRNAPEALQVRIARALIDRLPVGKKDFGLVHYESVVSLAYKKGTEDLPHGVLVHSDGKRLSVMMAKGNVLPMKLTLGEQKWGEYVITLYDSEDQMAEDDILLKMETENCDVWVRRWERNDRFPSESNGGERSLKRLCVDYGIAPPERDSMPVFLIGQEIAAAWKIGTSARFQPLVKEKNILKIHCERRDKDEK